MAKVEFDISEFEDFSARLKKLGNAAQVQGVLQAGVNKMAAAYIREAKKNTPVGKRGSVKAFAGKDRNGQAKYITYHYNTQQTRNAWRVNSAKAVGTTAFARVYNLSKYASFLNDGHRQEVGRYVPMLGTPIGGVVHGARLKKPWVEGLHMQEKAENFVERNGNKLLNSAMRGYLRELDK